MSQSTKIFRIIAFTLKTKTTISIISCTFLLFVVHYLCQQMHTHTHTHIYIKILNYITNAPTCFGASAPSSGSFDVAFVKVIKYEAC
jgi:SUMO ligase MMS21 Smc5/6 complex component